MARSTTSTKTASERIINTLKRGPKRGLSARAISERADINLNTTRTTLGALAGEGQVTVVGQEEPTFGRPANLYAFAG